MYLRTNDRLREVNVDGRGPVHLISVEALSSTYTHKMASGRIVEQNVKPILQVIINLTLYYIYVVLRKSLKIPFLGFGTIFSQIMDGYSLRFFRLPC